jgi:GT2 family glycosyltransferase
MKTAIIIVNWNGRELTQQCLEGLSLWEPNVAIYLVDNGSTDGSVAHLSSLFPSVIVIESSTNLGFGGGNNLGIEKALEDGFDAVFLLNNDTIIDEPFLEIIESQSDDPSIGIIGPVVVDGYGPETIQCRGGAISLSFSSFPYLGQGEVFAKTNIVSEVGYVLGAAMLIKKEVFDSIGMFDQEFFPAYVEEADLCYRARLRGFRSYISHSVRIRHIGGQSSGGSDSEFRRMMKNRFLFAIKHASAVQFVLSALVISARILIKKILVGK